MTRGSGVAAVTKLSAGVYRLDATQDISRCTYIGQIGDTGSATGAAGFLRTRQLAGSPDSLVVETFDKNAAPADMPFHVAVFC